MIPKILHICYKKQVFEAMKKMAVNSRPRPIFAHSTDVQTDDSARLSNQR